LDGELIAQGELQGNYQVGKWLEKRQEVFINETNFKTVKVYYLESYYSQNGLRNEISTGYQSSAKKVKQIEIAYQNGVKNGTRTMYYPDGKLHIKGDFANGKRNGLYQAWAENGTKIMETSFKDDLHNGRFTNWTPNGKLQYTGQYIDGKKEGDWICYDKKGNNLRSEGKYENDRKIGVWNIYFPEQKYYRKDFMKDGRCYEMQMYTDADCLYKIVTRNSNNKKIIEEFECRLQNGI